MYSQECGSRSGGCCFHTRSQSFHTLEQLEEEPNTRKSHPEAPPAGGALTLSHPCLSLCWPYPQLISPSASLILTWSHSQPVSPLASLTLSILQSSLALKLKQSQPVVGESHHVCALGCLTSSNRMWWNQKLLWSLKAAYLKYVMWFSSSAISRLLTAWNLSFSFTVTVPIPSGLDIQT